MNGVPITGLMYLFNALMSFIFTARHINAYKRNANLYTKMFYLTANGVAFTFFFYGMSFIFILDKPRLIGIMYILTLIPLNMGLSYGFRMSLHAWGLKKLEQVVSYVIPVLVALFVITHFNAIPHPIAQSGIIIWNIPFPFNYISILFVSVLATPPAFIFFRQKLDEKAANYKAILIGITFLTGSAGGVGVTLFQHSFELLKYSYVMLFSAFVIFSITFIIDLV